ncbi:ParB/RepB/Spo0J family partition protein [Nocardia gipuzkoensis]|uniref:ParB/RepB/Spo0J family partition protein n=1 Tax=Nocardia gipuzkoensis TaxID=2749991 RepID=UPI0015EF2247|nr:ParB N-terminal domain-containing protein [Nocardia gipuzkoensis]
MARGTTRRSLADLTDSIGDNSPVDGQAVIRPTITPTSAPLPHLVANPRNPRQDVGDLSDLESIRDRQLQPALVVARDNYLALYPEDESSVGDALWVVINGCRRLAAAQKYGRSELDIVVKNEVARDRISLLTAAIDENIGRRDFDVIEEAHAVEQLVIECGSAGEAAKQLNRTDGWVSQRRALLRLAPELQTALRAGELAVRVARSLARVPKEEQVARWRAEQEREENKPQQDEGPRPDPAPRPANAPHITKALRRFEPNPDVLAQALRSYLNPVQLNELVDALLPDH